MEFIKSVGGKISSCEEGQGISWLWRRIQHEKKEVISSHDIEAFVININSGKEEGDWEISFFGKYVYPPAVA